MSYENVKGWMARLLDQTPPAEQGVSEISVSLENIREMDAIRANQGKSKPDFSEIKRDKQDVDAEDAARANKGKFKPDFSEIGTPSPSPF